MGRILRPEAAGGTFHVYSRAVFGARLFRGDADRQDFLQLLARVAARYDWRVLSYCLLGTHHHLIVRTPQPNLGAGSRDLYGTYARRSNHRHGRRGALFSERYADRVLRGPAHLASAVRYVALNPVAAGLAHDAAGWPWSSHRALAGLQTPPAFLARAEVWALLGGPAGYASYVEPPPFVPALAA